MTQGISPAVAKIVGFMSRQRDIDVTLSAQRALAKARKKAKATVAIKRHQINPKRFRTVLGEYDGPLNPTTGLP